MAKIEHFSSVDAFLQSLDTDLRRNVYNNVTGKMKLDQVTVSVQENKQGYAELAKRGSDMFGLQKGFKDLSMQLARRGLIANYAYDPKSNKIIVNVSPTDKLLAQQWKNNAPKIEFDVSSQFRMRGKGSQLASDPGIMRYIKEYGNVLLSSSENALKEINDAITSQYNTGLKSALASMDPKKIQGSLNAAMRRAEQSVPTTGMNVSFKTALQKEMQEMKKISFAGGVNPQRVQYAMVKGNQIQFGKWANDLAASMIEAKKILAAQMQGDFLRAQQKIAQDIITEYAKVSAMGLRGSAAEKQFSKIFGGDSYKYLGGNSKQLAKIMADAVKSGVHFGFASDNTLLRASGNSLRARNILPFGAAYARESRAAVQGMNAAALLKDKSKHAFYSGGNTELIMTRQMQEAYKEFEKNYKTAINYSSSDQYRVAATSQTALNNAIRKFESTLDPKMKGYTQYKKVLNSLKKFGISEDGMILAGRVLQDLSYGQEVNRTIYQEDIDKVWNKWKNTMTKGGKSVYDLRSEMGATSGMSVDAYMRQIAAQSILARKHDFRNNSGDTVNLLAKEGLPGVFQAQILQKRSGAEGHRLLFGTGERVASSYLRGNYNVVNSVLYGVGKALGMSDSEAKSYVGFKQRSQFTGRNYGAQMSNYIYDILAQVANKGLQSDFISAFNKNAGDGLSGLFSKQRGKSGFVFDENLFDKGFDANPQGYANNFFGQMAKAIGVLNKGGANISNPFNNNNGLKWNKDFAFASGSLNVSDIFSYGSGADKGGRWLSVDDKSINTLSRYLGEGSQLTSAMVAMVKGTRAISEVQYQSAMAQVASDLSYLNERSEQMKEDKERVIVKLSALQKAQQRFDAVENKYVDGKLTREAYRKSPEALLRWAMRGKDPNKTALLVDTEGNYSFSSPYGPGGSSSTTISGRYMPIMYHHGEGFSKYTGNSNRGGYGLMDFVNSNITDLNAFIRSSTNGDLSGAARDFYNSQLSYYTAGSYFEGSHKGRLSNSAMLTAIASNTVNRDSGVMNFLNNGGVAIAPAQLREMLKDRSGGAHINTLTSLKDIYKDFYGKTPNLKGFKSEKEQEQFLINSIVSGVTVGGTAGRDKVALERGAKLSALFSRFPYIYGENLRFGGLVADKDLQKKQILMGLGMYRTINADFDSDKIGLSLAPMLMGYKQFDSDFAKAKDNTALQAKFANYFVHGGYSKDDLDIGMGSDVVKDGTYNTLNNATLDGLMEFVAKNNRSSVGTFSNLNQSIREGMHLLGYDSAYRGMNDAKLGIQAGIIGEFFASLEQDAISAKKIRNRLGGDLSNTDLSKFYTEVADMFSMMTTVDKNGNSIFDDSTKTAGAISKLQEMGIFDSDSALFKSTKTKGRLAYLLNQYATLPGGREAITELFGKERANALLDPFDANGNIRDGYDVDISKDEMTRFLVSMNKKVKSEGWQEIGGNKYNFSNGLIGGFYTNRNKILNKAKEYNDTNIAYYLAKLNGNAAAVAANLPPEVTAAVVASGFAGSGLSEGSALQARNNYLNNTNDLSGYKSTDYITKIIGSMMPSNYEQQSYEFKNSLLDLVGGTKSIAQLRRKLSKSNYLGYGSQVFNELLKQNQWALAGDARHGVAQTLLAASAAGINNNGYGSLLRKIKDNPEFLNANSKQMQDVASWRLISQLLYPDDPAMQKQVYNETLRNGGKFASIIGSRLGGEGSKYLGSEIGFTTNIGTNGREHLARGRMDALAKIVENGKTFLDVYDFKPGEMNSKYGAQGIMYRDALLQERNRIAKNGWNYEQWLASQSGKSFGLNSEEFFNLLRDENVGIRAGILGLSKNETAALHMMNNRGDSDFQKRMMGAFYLAADRGETLANYVSGDDVAKMINEDFVKSTKSGELIEGRNVENIKEIIKLETELVDIEGKRALIQRELEHNADIISNDEKEKKQKQLEELEEKEDKANKDLAERRKDKNSALSVQEQKGLDNSLEARKSANERALDTLDKRLEKQDLRALKSALNERYKLVKNITGLDLYKEKNAHKMDEAQLQEADMALEGYNEQLKQTESIIENLGAKLEDNPEAAALLASMQGREDVMVHSMKAKKGFLKQVSSSYGAQLQQMVMRFTSLYSILGMVKKAMNTLTAQAKQMNAAMTNLRIVTGNSAEETQNLLKSYSELGSQYGATTVEVANAANAWLRQGYSIAETNELIVASLHLSKLGMISSEEATKNLTSALKGFKMEASDAMSVVDKLTAVDMNAAVSAGDIATGLSQFATTAQLSGLNMDQAIAMVATVADVTQNGASSVGAAFKSMLSRFGNVKAGQYSSGATDEDGGSINDVEKVVNKIGISLRDANGEMRAFDTVLEDVSSKWEGLDSVSKNALATAFAGMRQREAFLVLMENMDKYHNLLEVSENSTGTAVQKYEAYADSIEAKTKLLQTSLEKLGNNQDVQNLVKDGLQLVTKLVDLMPKIIKYIMFLAKNSIVKDLVTVLSRKTGIFGAFGARPGSTAGAGGAGGSLLGGLGARMQGLGGGIWNVLTGGINFRRPSKQVQRRVLSLWTGAKPAQKERLEKNFPWIKEYKNIWEEQEKNASIKNPAKRWFMNNREGLGTLATTVVQAGVGAYMGYRSAPTTGSGSYTDAAGNKQTYTYNYSKQEQELAKGVGGFIGGLSSIPLIGPIISTFGMDIAKNFIGQKYKGLAEAQAKATQRSNSLGNVSSQLSTLGNLGRKATWSSADSSSFTSNIDSMAATLYEKENREGREQFTENLLKALPDSLKDSLGLDGNASLYSILEKMSSNQEDQKKLAQAMVVAQKMSIYQNLVASSGLQMAQTRTEAVNAYGHGMGINTGAGAYRAAGIAGTVAGAGVGIAATGGAISLGLLGAAASSSAAGPIGLVIGAVLAAAAGITALVTYTKAAQEENELANETAAMGYSEMIDNLKATREQMEKEGKYTQGINDYIKQLEAARDETYAQNKKIDQALIDVALADAKYNDRSLSSYSSSELKQIGAGRIENIIANYLVDNGGLRTGGVFTGNNKALTSQAKSLISSALKGSSIYGDVYNGRAYTASQIGKLSSTFTDAKGGIQVTDTATLAAQQNFARVLGVNVGDLATLFTATAANSSAQKQFAQNLGITAEQFDKLREAYGRMTLNDYLMTTSQVLEKIKTTVETITELTSGNLTTFEQNETILKNYPQYLDLINNKTELYRNLIEDSEALLSTQGKAFVDDILNSEEYFNTLRDSLKTTFGEDVVINSKKTLSELMQYGIETGNTAIEEWIEKQAGAIGDITNDLMQKYNASMINYQNHLYDEQINNLKEQKESLQNINSQREYENKLVEARLKLENATKEKTRVWREGIGWTYAANEDSIAAAEEDLEKLQNEQLISKLDLQIDELTASKEYLSNISERLKWSDQKDLYDGFKETLGGGVTNATIADALVGNAVGSKESILDYIKTRFATDETKYNQGLTDFSSTVLGENGILNQQIGSTGLSLKDFIKEDGSIDTKRLKSLSYNQHQAVSEQYGKYQQALKTASDLGITGERLGQLDGFSSNLYTSLLNKESIFTPELKGSIRSRIGNTPMGSGQATLEVNLSNSPDFSGDDLVSLYAARTGKNRTASNEYFVQKDPLSGRFILVKSGDLFKGTNAERQLAAKNKFLTASKTQPFFWVSGEGNGKTEAYYIQDGQAWRVGTNLSSLSKNDKNFAKNFVELLNMGLRSKKYNSLNNLNDNFGYAPWLEGNASGNLSFSGGRTLINELGTEAIITPHGTVTALPSDTGIVPADITKNLWQLGELAPSILASLGEPLFGFNRNFNSTHSAVDDSFNVNTINMTVEADSTFDADQFVQAIKTRVALSKNQR